MSSLFQTNNVLFWALRLLTNWTWIFALNTYHRLRGKLSCCTYRIFLSTPSAPQGLFLNLSSGISIGSVQRTIWGSPSVPILCNIKARNTASESGPAFGSVCLLLPKHPSFGCGREHNFLFQITLGVISNPEDQQHCEPWWLLPLLFIPCFCDTVFPRSFAPIYLFLLYLFGKHEK